MNHVGLACVVRSKTQCAYQTNVEQRHGGQLNDRTKRTPNGAFVFVRLLWMRWKGNRRMFRAFAMIISKHRHCMWITHPMWTAVEIPCIQGLFRGMRPRLVSFSFPTTSLLRACKHVFHCVSTSSICPKDRLFHDKVKS